MVRSMKMLDHKSLNQNQLQTLKEIDEQRAPELLEESAQKERHFRNMLSDIKLKSENMKRRKMHQPPAQRMQPAKGQPSFIAARDSQTELEQILKLKVDQHVIKDFLGTQQNAIGDTPDGFGEGEGAAGK